MFKNILLFISLAIIFSILNSCSNKIIYEEELNINKYEKSLLNGYDEVEYIKLKNVTVKENDNFYFYTLEELDGKITKYNPRIVNKKDGNEIKLKNIFIKCLIKDLKGNIIYFGNQGVYRNYEVYEITDKSAAIADSLHDHYEPFIDKQVPSVRIFKNENNFMVLYYFYFPPCVAFHQPWFYPILSVEAYEKILEKVNNEYNQTGDNNYLKFKTLYMLQSDGMNSYYEEKYGKYFNNAPENFYFLRTLSIGSATFYTIDLDFFNKYNYTMQDARRDYENFGFVGYDPLLVIVPVKINIVIYLYFITTS